MTDFQDNTARTLLLVDDEEGIINSLVRQLRHERYRVLRANSAERALAILSENPVGVIVSDYRMPGMNGVDFLRVAKNVYPDTSRIILSGFTDLDAVTAAINEGAVFKFLTKPWEETQIKQAILEAFEMFELRRENQRLTRELIHSQQTLELRAQRSQLQASARLELLHAQQDILASLPFALIGVGRDEVIGMTNRRAEEMFPVDHPATLVGSLVSEHLPEEMAAAARATLRSSPTNSPPAWKRHGALLYCAYYWTDPGFEGGALITLLSAGELPDD